MKHLTHITQYDKESMIQLFESIDAPKQGTIIPVHNYLNGYIMASLFLEPSTRTRLSFEAAMHKCGGKVISVANEKSTSIAKKESIEDTLKTIQEYCDIIVLRSNTTFGTLKQALLNINIPFINAGNEHDHPTQTLIDLYTIWQIKGKLDGLNVLMFGDNPHARTALSFKKGIRLFSKNNIKTIDITHPIEKDTLNQRKLIDIETKNKQQSLAEFMPWADVIYVTRPQKERWRNRQHSLTNTVFWNKNQPRLQITQSVLRQSKEDAILLHPLPKTNEIAEEAANDPKCKIWQQVKNGLQVRMALISQLLQG